MVCSSCLKACKAPSISVFICLFCAACSSSAVIRLINCTQAVSSVCSRLAVLLTALSEFEHSNMAAKKLMMAHQTGMLALKGVKIASKAVTQKPTMDAQAKHSERGERAKRGMLMADALAMACVSWALLMLFVCPLPWAIKCIRHVYLSTSSLMASRLLSTCALASAVAPGKAVKACASALLPPDETVRLSRWKSDEGPKISRSRAKGWWASAWCEPSSKGLKSPSRNRASSS